MEINSYITGFVDGEGCFSVSFSKRQKFKTGLEVRPSFSVSQHQRNKEIILFLQKHFNCGGVRFSKRDRNFKFEVRSIKDLNQIIIPHFLKFPLQTSKQKDFEKFRKICDLVKKNQHLNIAGLRLIIELASTMNEAGQRNYPTKDLLKNINKMNV